MSRLLDATLFCCGRHKNSLFIPRTGKWGRGLVAERLTSRQAEMNGDGSIPSADGEATMPGAGLAAVGEDASVAAVSTGAVPVWGDGREEEPVEAPPMLFCLGERGLWAEEKEQSVSQVVQVCCFS